MNTFAAHLRTTTLASLLTASLSACVVAPAGYPTAPAPYPGYPVYGQPQTETIIYGAAPPPLRVEVAPPVPFAGAVWIGGHWGWEGGRHRWVPGRYVQPVPGHRYVPHHWEQRNNRWSLRGGIWVR